MEVAKNISNIPEMKMLTIRFKFAATLCGLCMAATGMADELMIFPNNDQSAERQEQDKFACYSWAKDQSDFDPMAPPTATKPPPQEQAKRGGVGRGLIRGAAIGGIVGGGSSKDAKKGAAAGAAIGGMRRQDQKRQEAQSRQQWEREQQQIYAQKRSRYNRAYGACLEGKNYTVR